jgi:endogenous inhibitor of DNA gyrase (YacG/DUF329 family)
MGRLKCPTCGRVVTYKDVSEVRDRPFCSERCRLVDLGRWFAEEYRISQPSDEPAPERPGPPEAPDVPAG